VTTRKVNGVPVEIALNFSAVMNNLSKLSRICIDIRAGAASVNSHRALLMHKLGQVSLTDCNRPGEVVPWRKPVARIARFRKRIDQNLQDVVRQYKNRVRVMSSIFTDKVCDDCTFFWEEKDRKLLPQNAFERSH
jgi:hypothetical protein